MDFGEKLRTDRKRHGKSQRDLAAAVGIDHTYLSKIENGHMPPPSPETLLKIADCLDMLPKVLFEAAGLCWNCKGSGKHPLLARVER